MTHAEASLDLGESFMVLDAIRQTCAFRNWTLLAAHVRSTHAHLVVDGLMEASGAIRDCKAYASRALNSGSDSPTPAWEAVGIRCARLNVMPIRTFRCLVLLSATPTFAIAGQFTTSIGGTYPDVVSALTTDSAGNTYVVGTRNTATASNGLPAGSDVFLTKLDPNGNALFTDTFAGKGIDTPVVPYGQQEKRRDDWRLA